MFVKLTDHRGLPVWINLSRYDKIYPVPNGSEIGRTMEGGVHTEFVQETPEEIIAKIKEGEAQ